MGANTSKPTATEASSSPSQAEKWAHHAAQPARQVHTGGVQAYDARPEYCGSHHATDRLQRIAAEAHSSMQSSSDGSRRLTAGWHGDRSLSRPLPAHDTWHAEVTLSALKAWDTNALQEPTAQMAAMTLHNAPIKDSLRSRRAETADIHVFSHTIPTHGAPVTNQLSSGRCWLFATTNVVRLQVIKELNLKEFELSQSYLAFWDKLEKSNTFLENSIELADKALDDRVFGFLKTAPTNDGGQWDMVTNLIKKYGLVPKAVFPESYNSSNSSQINWLLTLKLREYALELRHLKKAAVDSLVRAGQTDVSINEAKALRVVRERKDAQMAEVYRIMVIALGVPPQPDKPFTFEYYDKQDKFHRLVATPLQFLDKYTGSFDPAGACSLVNDPRRAYSKLVTVDRLQNVWGGQPVLYVNTSTGQMKDCVIKSIKAGLPVFFGCDVGQFSNSGIMDPSIFNLELPFGIKLGLSKAERIEMGESSMTHAMVITGVHLNEQGKPVRYRVENSWGAGVGDKGYMVMSDAWFDEFVYQVVIRKQHMPAQLWKLFADGVNDQTDVLPPYDPMGALASSQPDSEQGALRYVSSSHEEEYEVEAILDHCYNYFADSELAYLVAWKGYGPVDNSRIHESNATNCDQIVAAYWANVGFDKRQKPAKARCSRSRSSTNQVVRASQPLSRQHRARSKAGRIGERRSTLPDTSRKSLTRMTYADVMKLDAEERQHVLQNVARLRFGRKADWEHIVQRIDGVRIVNGAWAFDMIL